MTVPHPSHQDAKGSTRSLSIASSPREPGILIATRLTDSAFKRSLAELPVGAALEVSGPFGKFGLAPGSDAPAAMVAGGIGITPFRSMIRDALDRRLARPLALLYLNRAPEDAAFLDELDAWQREGTSFRLIPWMTEPEKSARGWNGRSGRLDASALREVFGDLSRQDGYVIGSPRLMASLTQMFQEAGLSLARIFEDEFMGY